MKRIIFMAACLFLTICLFDLPQCWGFRHLKEGEIPPDFKLKDLSGKTHSLSQSKGKVVLVLYWRVGQGRSLKALKELKVVFEKLSDQPLEILAITKDTDKLSEIKNLKKSL
ncbi:MAG: redoxin domain-containing protein, partial [Deltaproteobacteria bacterium]|nr:redoxin domain-containing protein [Deltaproteobacteria bacterium]